MFERLPDLPPPPDDGVDALDADATLTRATDLRREINLKGVELLACAAHWADLHGHLDDHEQCSLPGTSRLTVIGGDGTPAVDDLCFMEFGACIVVSDGSGRALISDALDLRHRLPRVWAVMCDGQLPDWVGRKNACALVDASTARWADRLLPGRLLAHVDAAVIAADPDLADDRVEQQRDGHGAWPSRSSESGTRSIFIRGDHADIARFNAAIGRTADCLAALGSPDPEGIRRARAVGVLASPQQALDLYDRAAEVPAQRWPETTPAEHVEGSFEARAQRAAATDASTRGERQPRHRPVDPRPKAVLYVHVAADTLADVATGPGGRTPEHPVARVEGLGPATLAQVRRWLADSSVTVKPVIDLSKVAPVDCYEIPDRIREAVHLLHPSAAAPYSGQPGKSADLDHTDRYRPTDKGGRPRQTRLGNLAPFPRRPHRSKTHGRWRVKQPFPGVMVWQSPHGRTFLVDHTGTRQLN